MMDTVEGLEIELQQQKRINANLLDLLKKVESAFPTEARVASIIDEANRTKQVLDNCQVMIDEKKKAPLGDQP